MITHYTKKKHFNNFFCAFFKKNSSATGCSKLSYANRKKFIIIVLLREGVAGSVKAGRCVNILADSAWCTLNCETHVQISKQVFSVHVP